ncbi:conserved hypothetical protein [Candidatus Terasakiella magnetica]|nr:conserved hypothetical protein [Candidatus Terasakiella magnetica]
MRMRWAYVPPFSFTRSAIRSSTVPNPCRLCHSPFPAVIADFGHTPIAHRMLRQAGEPEELFSFVLTECPACGFVQVDVPIDPSALYGGFNFNFSSWKTEPHIETELAMIARYCVLDRVVEVGCNDGRFLDLVREQGAKAVVGIEPNPVPCRHAADRGITVVNQMLTSDLAASIAVEYGSATLVISRQVMEHVLDVHGFLRAINTMLAEGGFLFLDLPDSAPALGIGDCSFLWEEHVGYYTRDLLERLLSAHGFALKNLQTFDFSGGCIALLAQKIGPSTCESLPSHNETTAISGFAGRVEAYSESLHKLLIHAREKSIRVVLYGAGVRGCSVANFLKLAPLIDHVVDDQAERKGLFMPGVRLKVESLDEIMKDPGRFLILLAVNNENDARVSEKIRKLANDRALIMTICGPADIDSEIRKMNRMIT